MPLIKKYISIILFIICVSLGLFLLYGQITAFEENTKQHFKTNGLSYYQTNNKNFSIDEIVSKYVAGEFKSMRQEVLNAGIPENYYWLHFDITNLESNPNSFIIDIDNARLNELELFEVFNKARQSLGRSGDFYPFSKRTFLHKNFIYQISLQPFQKKEYFLFVNQVGHTFILPIKTFTAENFRSAIFKDYLFDGVTYGILLFVAVFSLLFFLSSKHYLYLNYSFYILTAIIWFLSYFGLGYQYIWGKYPALNTSISPVMASINIFLNLKICQILLKLSETNRLLNRTANCTKAILIAMALFPLFFNLNEYGYSFNKNYLVFFLIVVLLAMLIVSYSVVFYAIKGSITAKLYLLASLLKAFSIINLALLELGIAPAVYDMEGIMQIGIFIESTLLTYALAARYTNFKFRTFVKVIEAHESERLMLSKEIHDGVSSSLTGINYGIKNFIMNLDLPVDKRIQLEKLFNELNKVQMEARSISHNTMPDYIKDQSIADIVAKHVEEILNREKNNAEGSRIKINFSSNEQIVKFSEPIKLNIFRIVQEIITNIIRHSQATTADIVFSFDKKEMLIIAEDNGIGFREENNEKGMGIKNITSRVELLEGSMLIKSPVFINAPSSANDSKLPGYGTMIKIKIPYRNSLLKNNIDYDY